MTGSGKVATPRKRNPRNKREFMSTLLMLLHLIYPQGRGTDQERKGETREASQKAPREREGNAGRHEKKVIIQLMINNEKSVPVGWSREKILNIKNVDRSESKLHVLNLSKSNQYPYTHKSQS